MDAPPVEQLGEPGPYACADCGRHFGSSLAALACCDDDRDAHMD